MSNVAQVPQLAPVVQVSRFPVLSGLVQQGSTVHDPVSCCVQKFVRLLNSFIVCRYRVGGYP